MFVPVQVRLGAGGKTGALYDRGFELVGEKLQAFRSAAGDMSGPLRAIGQSLHLNVAQQFATQGALSGGWTPLSPAYDAWKRKHGGGPLLVGITPLQAKGTRPQTYAPSGHMRMQLLDPLAMHVTSHRLLYAPESDIAGYHETGTGKMPARPPVAVTPEILHSWDREFATWIQVLIQRSGL